MAETDRFSVTGHKYDDTTRPFIEFTGARRSGATLDTRLVIIPREAGVFIAVASKTEELDEAAADAWAQAAQCATLRLGTSATEYHWTAIIAPPAIRITGAEPAIEGEANVGVFRLVSTRQPLHERVTVQDPAGVGSRWSSSNSRPRTAKGVVVPGMRSDVLRTVRNALVPASMRQHPKIVCWA
jgi:hypothetical protein